MKTNTEDFTIWETVACTRVTYRSPKTRLTWTKIVNNNDKELINRVMSGDVEALDELKKLVKQRNK